ncbi:cytochrome C [Sulfurimonas sp. HSL3-7]|uniref:cytochrome C n=1 Tax=Sulfonitrofixus jiaomeiensis TaxID=3131938 RepID=UPI0031F8494A
MPSSDAAIYKGRIAYVEDCQSCHQRGDELLSSRTKSEWQTLMRDQGNGLAKRHLLSKDSIKSWAYFESPIYIKKSRHLKDFLTEYAKDSGNILACE